MRIPTGIVPFDDPKMGNYFPGDEMKEKFPPKEICRWV
jgi:hypothetical protein